MKFSNKYILDKDGKTPIIIESIKNWGEWMEANDDNKCIAKTDMKDGTWVSTVFLGVDHNFGGKGPPILFETMVFPEVDNYKEQYMWRYATWAEAKAGHGYIVEWLDEHNT